MCIKKRASAALLYSLLHIAAGHGYWAIFLKKKDHEADGDK